MLWVGIDVGGTFTDIVVYDDKSISSYTTTSRAQFLLARVHPHRLSRQKVSLTH